MTTREIGNIGESYTVEFLKRNGCEILHRNYTIRGGEIDIVAKKGSVIHFVEVKSRKKSSLTSAESAITSKKISCIVRTAKAFLNRECCDCCCVFDVAAVELESERVTGFKYIQRAFTA